MKSILTLLFVICGFLLFAQQTETRSLASFSGVKAAEGIDVYLTKGTK
jgi:hypothetical protein